MSEQVSPSTSQKPARRIARTRMGRAVGRLCRNRKGSAMVEFALALPAFMTLGMYGTELSYMAVTSNNVSQAALNLADSASRVAQVNSGSAQRRVNESDIESVFRAVEVDTGDLDLVENGRVILTSLERNSNNGQWIHWQRCIGTLDYGSTYGAQGTGASGTGFAGMGPSGQRVTSVPGSAVMYVEIFYEHRGLFGSLFLPEKQLLTHEAAFQVRDERILANGLIDDSDMDMTCPSAGATPGGNGGGSSGGSSSTSSGSSTSSTSSGSSTSSSSSSSSSNGSSGNNNGSSGNNNGSSGNNNGSSGNNNGSSGNNNGSSGNSSSSSSSSSSSGGGGDDPWCGVFPWLPWC